MKLRYLLLLPLLTGCVGKIEHEANFSELEEEHYVNVSYHIKRDNVPYYYVFVEEYNKTTGYYDVVKEWNVALKNVEHLFYSGYEYVEGTHEIIYDEFYVKGNNYTLILYHYFK